MFYATFCALKLNQSIYKPNPIKMKQCTNCIWLPFAYIRQKLKQKFAFGLVENENLLVKLPCFPETKLAYYAK